MNGADQPIVIKQVDALVLGLGQIGRGAYLRLTEGHPMKVIGIDNSSNKLAPHLAAKRDLLQGDAADSDFWNTLILTDSVKLVLLPLSGHADNAHASQQLRHRAFSGHIAAIVCDPEEVKILRELGANTVVHVDDEARAAFADDALAALKL